MAIDIGDYKMKKIGICGHFAQGKDFFDGQTVKTKIVTRELLYYYGKNNIECVDTFGGRKKIIKKIVSTVGLLKKCKNVIILPAQNGILAFVPTLAIANKIYKKNLHYMVVGGWLPEFIEKRKWLIPLLKNFNYIYVETSSMKLKLEKLGLHNVIVIPNFKQLNILNEEELIYPEEEPLKLCTFSRVMKEKGIEEAIAAIREVNRESNNVRVLLDIYGQVDSNQIEWFEQLQNSFPDYVKYRGVVPFDESTEVLKHYFALLFPTYYEGEGFAGTLIDAMAAGVPVIASDWKYNSEIVHNGENGIVIKDGESLTDLIYWILDNKQQWNSMRKTVIAEAEKYLPRNALKQLVLFLD